MLVFADPAEYTGPALIAVLPRRNEPIVRKMPIGRAAQPADCGPPVPEGDATRRAAGDFHPARGAAGFGFCALIVIDRDLLVLLKLTKIPCSRSCGASRPSSFPSIVGVFGQRGDAVALFSTTPLSTSSNWVGDPVQLR